MRAFMEGNSKLTEEMKSKIDSYLEKHEMKKLSADELEQVSGGEGVFVVEGVEMTEFEFNDMMLAITDEFGYDAAEKFFSN